jgi:hypothetical protein
MSRCGSRHMSVGHLEGWAVLRPRPAVIVDASRGDVRMPEPFLHLGDVGLMVERIGGGRRPQRALTNNGAAKLGK